MADRLLVVDDDANIRDVISFAAENAGFSVDIAENGRAALESTARRCPDLIVLDIGLPEMDGLEVCREIRKGSSVPILFLTARNDEIDRIVGLEIGGDDYVAKPFSPRELIARIKAILKRTKPAATTTPSFSRWGDLQIDPDRHLCRVGVADVALTASEFLLLRSLMVRPENVVTRQHLMNAVYGHNIHVSERTVDSHIRNIRNKFAKAGCSDSIVTVHGVGLRMGSCRTA